ncbi:hypothetical protein EYZ11_009671 [Aspergillus tanneri]|uniref:Uncharacterized protein n=1 Tax=Aspergillus tanneri TaxID=1220188 RepID=A0A4S3J7B8_9EURO|nr:hypothetical protein EYZ11_009671 [Aspergillus tanneri]
MPESLISLVETILICLETRLLLVVKGAKEYFFMSTILALAKVTLWPEQANVYKQEVVERVIFFAQTLFSRHANCAHLGDYEFVMLQSEEGDPFLDAFDWTDLTGITFE